MIYNYKGNMDFNPNRYEENTKLGKWAKETKKQYEKRKWKCR